MVQRALFRVAFGSRPFLVVASTPSAAMQAALALTNEYLAECGQKPVSFETLREFEHQGWVDKVVE